jgi:hypothetical protein
MVQWERFGESLTLVCQLLYIQHSDLDALLGKQMHNGLSNAIAATRHNNDLLLPIIRVLVPVVRHRRVEPCAEASDQTEPKDGPEVLERCGVF